MFWYYKAMKRIIVAYDKNRGIGASNDLLWLRDLPADLRHFRDATMGSTVIMGRKTYESIGKPLANRHNIVISRTPGEIDGVTVVSSFGEAYAAASTKDVYVIGGGQVYELAIDSVDEVLATEVDATFPQAEIFFPEISKEAWQETSREHHERDESNKYAFDWVTYARR
jgi:dihydrofolate reductase